MHKKTLIIGVTIFSLLILGVACKKEILQIFEVQTQQVSQTNINKESLKKEIEYVSIAYSDLFGKTIPADELRNAISCYAGSNDKELITDRIIRSFLNRGNIAIPSQQKMLADIPGFVANTYDKFYHRPPNSMEQWKLEKMIKDNSTLNSIQIYYSFLSSSEYKFK